VSDSNPENTFKKSYSVRGSGDGVAVNQELVNTLRGLGLNQYEARAYLALTTSGASTAGELSEQAELPRPRVYDVLKGLQDKGFVALNPGRPVKYNSLPLPEAIKSLKRHRENQLSDELKRIDEVGQALASRLNKAVAPSRVSAEEVVWTLRGRDVIYSKIASMLQAARSHVTVATTAQGLGRKLKHHGRELEACKARGVKVHVTAPASLGDAAKIVSHHAKTSLPTRLVLADDEALFFLTKDGTPAEDEIGMWVRSPHLADTLRGAAGVKG
jgi:sugar-specific transcriptional regulator TrmB